MQDAPNGTECRSSRADAASASQCLGVQSDFSSPSAEMTPESDSKSENSLGLTKEQEDLEWTFELKSMSKPRSKRKELSTLLYDESEGDSHWDWEEEEEEEEEEENNSSFLKHRRARDSTVQSFMLYTPDEERAVVRKFDRRLVLFVAVLYMLSFLDRSNIGNARIAGLSRDLQLNSSQYEWLLTAFYLTYILFEWMTLLYRIIPPHIYIALCVASWGLIASLQSVANSFSSILVLRAVLGICEAAFGPGVPFYLSFFFKREELALRTGLFISAAPLATSFASSLAWVITKACDNGPIAAWRVLFLVEGFPSMVVAVLAWHHIPDSPETARYLSRREQKVASLRLRKERGTEGGTMEKTGLSLKEIISTLMDPKCYFTAMMFFSCNVAFSSMPVFLPTILAEMGYSNLAAQGLSAPPYLAAFLIVLLTAFLSDHYRSRSTFVIFHALLGTCGYLMIAVAGWREASIAWRYAGIFPASAGFFSAITIIITWTINNQDSDSKKGTGVAMLNLIGQLGPLVGTRLYPDSDGPYYVRGFSICAGFMFGVFVLSLGLRVVLSRENRKMEMSDTTVVDEDKEGLVGNGRRGRRQHEFTFML